MKSFIAIQALVAAAASQSLSIGSTSRAASSAGNVQASSTASASGPISTSGACQQIANTVKNTRTTYPAIDAQLAYACLKTVPIDKSAATLTIQSLINLVNLQSTIAFLKTPPKGYANDAVDILGGLNDIGSKVNSSSYSNEFDFENDIAALLTKAHDGHLNFDGMAYSGVFRWRRSRQITLAAGSTDGKSVPKIYAIQDFNQTGSFTPSAVTQINGQDVVQFLLNESAGNSYHDPDTRFNALLWMQPAENYGYFANPNFYPGPTTNFSFENGTSNTYSNYAIVLDPASWSSVSDGNSFYKQFIVPSSSSRKIKRTSPRTIPRQLDHWRDIGFIHNEGSEGEASVPSRYPKPFVSHSASGVPLAGFFINTSKAGTVGILMIGSFDPNGVSDSRQFQSVIQAFINEAKSRSAKIVIDVRTNGGGKILLGYDAYLQFFPSQKPQLQSRYRGTQTTNILGDNISTLNFTTRYGELYTSPFNYHSYLDKDLKAFGNWKALYGPTTFNNDNFTNLLRYNLSDPLVTSSTTYSIGITPTGYGDRSNFTADPFKKEDIIILSDGICASTCSLFVELMVQQSGVRTLAVGGRPQLGPMQPVGGTKGSLVLSSQYLIAFAQYVISSFATSRSQQSNWLSFMPGDFGVGAVEATVNFQDNIRKGLEKDGIPTQFLNDTASCRFYYKASDYLNVTAVWTSAAEIAFGKNGTLDDGACVAGSVTTQQAQTGQGDGNPTTTSSGSATPSKSKGAASSVGRPQGGWTAIIACGVIVMGSMIFGASLI